MHMCCILKETFEQQGKRTMLETSNARASMIMVHVSLINMRVSSGKKNCTKLNVMSDPIGHSKWVTSLSC